MKDNLKEVSAIDSTHPYLFDHHYVISSGRNHEQTPNASKEREGNLRVDVGSIYGFDREGGSISHFSPRKRLSKDDTQEHMSNCVEEG